MRLNNIKFLWTLTEIDHGTGTLQETYFFAAFWLGSQNLHDKNGGLFYCIYVHCTVQYIRGNFIKLSIQPLIKVGYEHAAGS
jgi:hypothetical protein